MAARQTVRKMLNGQLKDYNESSKQGQEPEHVRAMKILNWSYGVKTVPISFSSESTEVEILSDFDSLAINVSLNEVQHEWQLCSKFIHVEDFVVDLANMVAFRKRCPLGLMHQIIKSKSNDRTRSRLTERKPFDLTAVFQATNSLFFAKRAMDFARMWFVDINNE